MQQQQQASATQSSATSSTEPQPKATEHKSSIANKPVLQTLDEVVPLKKPKKSLVNVTTPTTEVKKKKKYTLILT